MNGTCIQLTANASIAVDYWRRDSAGVVACFLTHMHADHTAGLSNSWHGAPLYCSHDTRALMQDQWPAVAERAHALEVGEATSLQLRCRDGSVFHMQVTPLDACHCLVGATQPSLACLAEAHASTSPSRDSATQCVGGGHVSLCWRLWPHLAYWRFSLGTGQPARPAGAPRAGMRSP